MSYTIMINEEQRKLITDALEYHSMEHPELYLTDDVAIDDLPPGAYLVEMFANLPKDEEGREPGTVHGFCL